MSASSVQRGFFHQRCCLCKARGGDNMRRGWGGGGGVKWVGGCLSHSSHINSTNMKEKLAANQGVGGEGCGCLRSLCEKRAAV